MNKTSKATMRMQEIIKDKEAEGHVIAEAKIMVIRYSGIVVGLWTIDRRKYNFRFKI